MNPPATIAPGSKSPPKFRDATGNVLAVYEQVQDTITWTEQHLYGSSRLGMVHPRVVWKPEDSPEPGKPYFKQNKNQVYGAKRYELTNHLGNVTATISDRKMPYEHQSQIYFDAVVHSAADYFPFGSLMTERTFSAGGYRFGFNTQEKLDELKGEGNHYTAQFWEYDPRIVHRWNLDPRPNPSMSGYAILGGNPIMFTDWAGDTILAVFDKSANTLEVMDMDHFDPSKPFERVGHEDYKVGGVYDADGNILKNQILVIEDVFTGGQSDSRGNITYGNNEHQLAIPSTVFEILEFDREGWYRLDPIDSNPRNDRYDNPNFRNAQGELRTNFRLHIGSRSHGCITCNMYNREAVKAYQVLEQILDQTSTTTVQDNWGRFSWLFNRTTTKYGEVKVR